MKLKSALVFALLLATGYGASDPPAAKSPALKRLFPAAFPSLESAMEYKRSLGAGGRVDIVRFTLSSYLVVFCHGSGIPVIGIGIYRWHPWGQHWELVSEVRPPAMEFFRAKPSQGKIVLVGNRSSREWPIFEPE